MSPWANWVSVYSEGHLILERTCETVKGKGAEEPPILECVCVYTCVPDILILLSILANIQGYFKTNKKKKFMGMELKDGFPGAGIVAQQAKRHPVNAAPLMIASSNPSCCCASNTAPCQ